MANRSLEKKLKRAEKAYRKRDKHTGARLVEEILQQDFNHPGAWYLLHRLYGGGKRLEEFRHSFVGRFYPQKLDQLVPIETALSQIVEPQKKPGFLRRLFQHKETPPTQPSSEGSQPSEYLEAQAVSAPPAAGKQWEKESGTLQSTGRLAVASDLQMASQTRLSTGAYEGRGLPGAFHPYAGEEAALEKVSSGEKIRIVLADDIAQTRETVIRALRFQDDIEVVGTALNGLQAVELARQLKPDVVIMDVNMPGMDGIAATALIKRDTPATEIVILTVQDDMGYMRQAMLAGARDFLAKPPMIDDLIQTIQRAGKQARLNYERLPAVSIHAASASGTSLGKIITVYSPRGGSGCTMLALNLAIGLQREDSPVVLVDGDLQYGDVGVQANTQGKNTILDLAPRVDELDPEIVNDVLVAHPTGIRILHPPRLERAELITGQNFGQLIGYLGKLYPYVVVDTTHRLTETTMAALDVSTLILLVSTLDIPSISRIRKFLELAPQLNLNAERLHLVVNQFDPRVGIGLEKLPQAFGIEPFAVLPLAYAPVIESINRGVPILARRETAQAPTGQALLALVRQVKNRLHELEQEAVA
jgi:pilus assembly protein CpaE